MDRLEKSTSNNNDGFIKAVFPFDEAQKGILLNIAQYVILAVIPIVILLRVVKTYSPEAEDDKGSLVITVEILVQLLFMFFALYFIHKTIEYIPTYSGMAYEPFSMTNTIPVIILFALTIQSKLGDKLQILVDRLMDLYDGGSSSTKSDNKNQGQVRVTQPLSQQYAAQAPTQMSAPPPQAVSPPPQLQSQMTNMKSQTNEYSIPQNPDFNNMYAGPETPLVGAANPSMEPMAANDFLGGSFGTSF